MDRFPIIFSKSVVFEKLLCVNTLCMFSPLTAALDVVDFILNFILLHCGNLGAFGLSFYFTRNGGKWKARHQQEAAGTSRSRIQNKHIQKLHHRKPFKVSGSGGLQSLGTCNPVQ